MASRNGKRRAYYDISIKIIGLSKSTRHKTIIFVVPVYLITSESFDIKSNDSENL